MKPFEVGDIVVSKYHGIPPNTLLRVAVIRSGDFGTGYGVYVVGAITGTEFSGLRTIDSAWFKPYVPAVRSLYRMELALRKSDSILCHEASEMIKRFRLKQ